MDLYTSERLLLARHRAMARAAERRARLTPPVAGTPVRVWMAARLRSMADRLDGRPRLQRVVP
jgi:hypothetical protein